MSNKIFEVIIVGAGPIGLACGIEAVKRKMNYLILEEGCLVNSIYNYPMNMTFFSTSDRLEIGEVPFISHGPKPTRSEALEYYRRVVTSWKLNVQLYEKVVTINDSGKLHEVVTNKNKYLSKKVIISTGFYGKPNLMNIPGEDLAKVKHYYDDPHPFFNQKVIVVGSANSAVDVALETFRKGAEVTMVIRESEINKRVKYWVKPDIENRIKEGSIKAYFNSSIIEIRENEVDVKTPEGVITIKNDFVLAMTGYQPDFSFLENCGIEISKNENREPVCNSNTFETNKDGIFLAGVVCAGMQTNRLFIENSRSHAKNIFDFIQSTHNSSDIPLKTEIN